jgi:hypothetical protein
VCGRPERRGRWLTPCPPFPLSLSLSLLFPNAANVELMMMGKVERDHFYVHFSKPLTVLMAFGIALSSFHKKYLVK